MKLLLLFPHPPKNDEDGRSRRHVVTYLRVRTVEWVTLTLGGLLTHSKKQDLGQKFDQTLIFLFFYMA